MSKPLDWAGISGHLFRLAPGQDGFFWEVFPAPEAVDATVEAFYHLVAGDVLQACEIAGAATSETHRLVQRYGGRF
jgi:hypothetical protein